MSDIDLRDYFAGKALEGALSTRHGADWKTEAIEMAKKAYMIADAMLAERTKAAL